MAYGLVFKNNSDVVALDSEFARLVVLHSARYTQSGAMFPAPITSQEPPLIFARPDATATFQEVQLLGGPGNWTGWQNGSSVNVPGTYFLAAYEAKPSESYGLRLWGANSKLLFDNGNPCAQFTTVITQWTFLGVVNTSPGRWQYSWSSPAPILEGGYILVNNVAMDMPARNSYSWLTCGWSYETNTVSIGLQNIGDFNQNNFFFSLLFGKPML
ncbi:hypothetical protein [Pseudomonas sp. MF7453]|uniref:hypothetical protein n=1 Tax=Pseudomonas sp. MF7453 TaxID=2797539 RepID=UPI0018E7FD97|nr:hypothetical protein [Pseudomonas sp. MF7453]MBJ2216439.1 hypothetical protein [Pseudomonas sp. MF7453]